MEDRTAPAGLVVANAPIPAVQNQPAAIIAADFNGDGVLDRAIANKASGEVSVFLGRDDGTFREKFRFFTGGTGPDLLLAHDLNNSGTLDLTVISLDSNRVLHLYGHGDGTFHALDGTPGEEEGIVAPRVSEQRALLSNRASGENTGLATLPTSSFGDTSSWDAVWYWAAFELLSADGNTLAHAPREIWDWLLNSVALDAPADSVSESLTAVLVVNGPGFTGGVDVFSPWGNLQTGAQELPVERALTSRTGVLAPMSAAGEMAARPAGPTRSPSVDQAALNSFNLALERVFQADRLEGLPGSAPQHADSEATTIRDRRYCEEGPPEFGGQARDRTVNDILPDAPPGACDTDNPSRGVAADPAKSSLIAVLTIGICSAALVPAEGRAFAWSGQVSSFPPRQNVRRMA